MRSSNGGVVPVEKGVFEGVLCVAVFDTNQVSKSGGIH
jgi:hypothetical protein